MIDHRGTDLDLGVHALAAGGYARGLKFGQLLFRELLLAVLVF